MPARAGRAVPTARAIRAMPGTARVRPGMPNGSPGSFSIPINYHLQLMSNVSNPITFGIRFPMISQF